MRLTKDHSAGAQAVSVTCLACGRMVRLYDAIIDLDGPAYEAYYHKTAPCAPGPEPTGKCNRDGCPRPECRDVD